MYMFCIFAMFGIFATLGIPAMLGIVGGIMLSPIPGITGKGATGNNGVGFGDVIDVDPGWVDTTFPIRCSFVVLTERSSVELVK